MASSAPPGALTLNEALERARTQYPLTSQADLIARSATYSVDNAYRGYYPQIAITAQATYQSDVTAVPIKIPGLSIPSPSQDQYRVQAEITQLLYDGGAMSNQGAIASATATTAARQLDVELHKLRDRVQQLFAGILLINEQLTQVRLKMTDIDAALVSMQAGVEHGAVLRSNVHVLKAERLMVLQRETKLRADRSAYLSMLSLFIGTTVDTTTSLLLPTTIALIDSIRRPELPLFAAQQRSVDARSNAINARSMPRVLAFAQGGYGRPALNMLLNDFDTYYVAGVRLQWSLTDLYASSAERELLDIERSGIDVQRSTFLFNTAVMTVQQRLEIDAYEAMLALDDEIIAHRTAVRETSKAQLEQGTITAHDYLRDVNALDSALRDRSLHSIQRALAMLTHASTTGN